MNKTQQFNIGYHFTRKHCDSTLGGWISSSFECRDFTFADLNLYSNRFANVLRDLEIGTGEVVFTFLPKTPEQFVAFLGGLKAECISGTLFLNFGDDALSGRSRRELND